MAQSDFNLQLIEEFRANGGEIVSGRFKGLPLLLLTTTGRKTGEPRTTPVGYTMDGDQMYIHTVNAGRPQVPQWYWNMAANPDITLEIGAETHRATAVLMSEQESERLLARFADREPRLQPVLDRMTAEAAPNPPRQIPIVRVERL
ncbi:MAG: nitroreductase/quinone reductase family protein [Dehalococcoidia bacterium]